MIWESLSEPWQVCTELAWEAYCAGSLPIASVIANQDGSILSSGRNRIFERASPPNLAGHPLAHAEMNALISFDYAQHNSLEAVLYTTTEPCPLCMGAIRMAGVRVFHFASRDPWAGCSAMTEQVPYLKQKNIVGVAPQSAEFENVLTALQVETHLQKRGPSRIRNSIEKWRRVVSVGVEVGERLYRSGQLQALAKEKVSAREVVESVHGLVS